MIYTEGPKCVDIDMDRARREATEKGNLSTRRMKTPEVKAVASDQPTGAQQITTPLCSTFSLRALRVSEGETDHNVDESHCYRE